MRVSIAVMTLVLCGAAGSIADAQQPPTPTDFSVRYEVEGCQRERFDSAFGEYVRPLPVRFSPQPLTARIPLTDLQVNTIFRMVANFGFFDYPSAFKGTTGRGASYTVSPSSTYRLEVRNGGVSHAVSWTDAYSPTTPEWDRLHALGRMIIGYVHDHPEFKALRPHFPCE